MSSPKISVVMSVYNGEKYLGEAIDSILKQTFSDFEFIIINDGSTDKTLEIIKSYMKKDDRIVLVSRENKGLIVSLNEGLDLAKGQYIARMDADDISIKSRFEKQIEFLDSNPDIGVCGTWVEVFGENIKSKKWKMPTQDPDLKA
ncbi:TPA: glycosyltransferase family 2 protein, partial [Vibrio cholerae]|nr:glycosyltransferase family 2 protein [Vibrio cholerae]